MIHAHAHNATADDRRACPLTREDRAIWRRMESRLRCAYWGQQLTAIDASRLRDHMTFRFLQPANRAPFSLHLAAR